jgi:hypothetical protein
VADLRVSRITDEACRKYKTEIATKLMAKVGNVVSPAWMQILWLVEIGVSKCPFGNTKDVA